jgi:hypothetical protein
MKKIQIVYFILTILESLDYQKLIVIKKIKIIQ